MFQSLAAYLQDSPGLVKTGPGLVRLKVAHVRTGPELDRSLPVLGSPVNQIFVITGTFHILENVNCLNCKVVYEVEILPAIKVPRFPTILF